MTSTRPASLLLITATAIFLLEGLIMLVLHLASAWVSLVPSWVVGLLDASVLSATVFPLLYMVWFRPLCVEMAKRRGAENELKRSHAELEVLVQQRTQELARANESFRVLVQTAQDAVISCDDRVRVTFWNATAERLFGYRAEEMLGRGLTLIMPERFRGVHTAEFQHVLAQGEPRVVGKTVELVGLKKDGTECPVELSLASWSVANQRYFTAIIRDISERKRVEEVLKESNRKLTSMNNIMLNREERILEMKNEVNMLLQELGRSPRYQV